jgi:hypothetical protein
MTIGETAQRPARDVEDALGLHDERAGDDLLGSAQRQLDRVALEIAATPRTAVPHATGAHARASSACSDLGARVGEARSPSFGLARQPRLGADLLGLRPGSGEHVGRRWWFHRAEPVAARS